MIVFSLLKFPFGFYFFADYFLILNLLQVQDKYMGGGKGGSLGLLTLSDNETPQLSKSPLL